MARYISVGDRNVISERSGAHGSCVGVSRPTPDRIEVRHTKQENSKVLPFTEAGWKDVLTGLGDELLVKLGRESMPIGSLVEFNEVNIVREGPDAFDWYSKSGSGTNITFTCAEMDSFIDGVSKGEFQV